MDKDYVDRIRGATFPLGRRGYEKREVERFLGEVADWLETGGADQARSDLVRAELERVGQRTAKILAEAHDVAESIRAEAEREARALLGDANAKAEAMRGAADEYASETRTGADTYAVRTRNDAEAEAERARIEADTYAEETRAEAEAYAGKLREDAERVLAEGKTHAERAVAKAKQEGKRTLNEAKAEAERHRAAVQKEIAALEERRDGVVSELERLASEGAGTAPPHRAGDGNRTSAEPATQGAKESRAG